MLALCACSDQLEDDTTLTIDDGKADGPSTACRVGIDPLREIEVVHPDVIDPTRNGGRSSNLVDDAPWSFRTLIEQLAPSPAASDTDRFVDSIFDTFERRIDVNSNGWSSNFEFEDDLVPRVGDFTRALTEGRTPHYDLRTIPFRLLAIANRVDLRATGRDAGEGRLVFGLDTPTTNGDTIIFEYKLPLIAGDLDTPEKWAAAWHELGTLEVGTAEYNERLVALTRRFTHRPNGGGPPKISQVRTNEFAFDFDWEFREFELDRSTGLMVASTTKATPNPSLDGTTALAEFIKENAAALLAPDFLSFTMPMSFSFVDHGTPRTVKFLGAKAERSINWSVPSDAGVDPAALARFSQLTCNGCHGVAAGGPGPGFHIDPTDFTMGDGTSKLSRFMFDPNKPDDDANPPDELRRRAKDMRTLLCADSLETTRVTFIIDGADFTRPGEDIAVVGNVSELGAWNPENAIRLDGSQFPTWTGTIVLRRGAQIEFKAIEQADGHLLQWEHGPNRTFQVPDAVAATVRGTWRR